MTREERILQMKGSVDRLSSKGTSPAIEKKIQRFETMIARLSQEDAKSWTDEQVGLWIIEFTKN